MTARPSARHDSVKKTQLGPPAAAVCLESLLSALPDTHVISPLGLARLDVRKLTTSHFPHMPLLFSTCATSLSLSLLSCPSFTLVVKRLKSCLKQPSRPARCTPVLLADDSQIARVALADFKTRKAIGPCCTRLALPLLTIPWSGLFKNWKGFQVVYRIAGFYCVCFQPYFILDSSALQFPVSPFDLEFILDIHHDAPYPHHLYARCRAPHDYSVDFHIFRTQTLLHMTLRSLSPAVSLNRSSC